VRRLPTAAFALVPVLLLATAAPPAAAPLFPTPHAAATVLLVADVGERARTLPAETWRKLASEYVGAPVVAAEEGTALPDDARCRASHAVYAVLATFDRTMRLPGLAQDNDRLYGIARFTVRNCVTGAVSATKTVRVESEPLSDARAGAEEPNVARVWERAIAAALARDPLVLAATARVVSVENGVVIIENTGRFSAGQVLRAFANASGRPYPAPVQLVVLEAAGRFVQASVVGKTAPHAGDYVEPLPANAK
jgi:hypothetical protein